MHFCARHNHDLAVRIKHKGMWHLCATDPEVVRVRTVKWLEGNLPAHEFDPLIASILEIHAKMREEKMMRGVRLNGMTRGECTLCEATVLLRNPSADAIWIDACTDLMLEVCKNNGIVLRSQ